MSARSRGYPLVRDQEGNVYGDENPHSGTCTDSLR